MAKQLTYIDEQEASHLIGLTVEMLIRQCNEKKIPVRISRATRKAKPRFVKEDIQTLLDQKTK